MKNLLKYDNRIITHACDICGKANKNGKILTLHVGNEHYYKSFNVIVWICT